MLGAQDVNVAAIGFGRDRGAAMAPQIDARHHGHFGHAPARMDALENRCGHEAMHRYAMQPDLSLELISRLLAEDAAFHSSADLRLAGPDDRQADHRLI